jgi:ABC-type sulfate/molybdate transport systems ATPase subunit/ABC-type sulfate transport system permease component
MRRGASSPLPWLGALLFLYLAFPIGAFALRLIDTPNRGFGASGLTPALETSVESATISLALITVLGLPLAYALVVHRGRVASVVGVLVQLPLALPPLMSGILLIFVLGPYTPLGRLFDGRLTESLTGIVLAQSFVAAPFLIIAARSAFATVDPALRDVAASLGHRPLARFFLIDLRCAAGGIRAGMVLAWLRAFGEYGATVIVAYHPFSLPIYTDNQFEAFPLSTTAAPTALALAVATTVVVLGQLHAPSRRRRRGLPPARPPGVVPRTPVGFALDLHVGTFRLRATHASAGSHLAVLGPSGSGKSVTLRALAGLLGSDVGTVTFNGTEVHRAPPERRRIGYVPQGLGLIPGLTVRQQVLFGVHADPALAAWWVMTLHLEELLHRYPQQLSGGQRQRVSLARALAAEPEVVLLDEPFSALDAPVRDDLRRELRRLQLETGLSTVIVTHDPREAAFLAEDVVVIVEGAVLQSGPVGTVYRRPASPAVGRLLGVENLFPGVVRSDGSALAGALPVPLAERLPGGASVLWRVEPDRVLVVPLTASAAKPDAGAGAGAETGRQGSFSGHAVDVVDLGASTEITVQLDGGLQLRSRRSGPASVRAGEPCQIRLSAQDVTAWLA